MLLSTIRKNLRIVKAKKAYKCDLTNRTISVGERYKRLNINGVGVFHFDHSVKETRILKYINNYIGNQALCEEVGWCDGENGEY